MRLIDADAFKDVLVKHFDASYGENGRLLYSDHVCTGDDVEDLIKLVDEQPTAFDFEDVLNKLEEEARISEEEKLGCVLENASQFDRVNGYLNGILNAKLFVEGALIPVKSESKKSVDCDEIVQQIEQLRVQYFITTANTGIKALDVAYEKVYQALDKVIEIVKAGGKNDK